MGKLLIAVLLFLSSAIMAGEENGINELSNCMIIGAMAGDIQSIRQETGDTEEVIKDNIRKIIPNGVTRELFLSITSSMFREIPEDMPPAIASDVVVKKCLGVATIKKMMPAEPLPEIEFEL